MKGPRTRRYIAPVPLHPMLLKYFHDSPVFRHLGTFKTWKKVGCQFFFFFFQALNFLVESFRLLNDLFPLPSILDAGYPVFDPHLADALCDVILSSVLGSSL